MAHTVCNATIIGVRYKVKVVYLLFISFCLIFSSVYILIARTLIYVNDAKHILSLYTQRTIHFSR